MYQEITDKCEEIKDKREEIKDKREEIKDKREEIKDKREEIKDKREEIKDKCEKITDKYKEITEQAAASVREIIEVSGIKKGQILVVGCSTSEICGSKIGTNSNLDVAKAAFKGIYDVACAHGFYVATQCCEHLNRAIITERAAVPFSDIVNVVPQPKAGGSLSTTAYQTFADPVAVEEIRADAGIDIGGTLIGMHLKKVAVPVRLEHNRIGEAQVFAARTRPKFIGGERAHYDDNLR